MAHPSIPYYGRELVDGTGVLLPSGERDSGRTEWSSLAQRYGHPIEKFMGPDPLIPIRLRILQGTGKSGLTPLPSPQTMSNPQTQAQRHFARLGRRRLETHQRKRLRGFTAAELVDMNVVTAVLDDKMAAGLNNPIHFMFERKRWFKMSDYRSDLADIPILGDHDGFWTANNDLVWDLMLPSIKLASAFLFNAHSYTCKTFQTFHQRAGHARTRPADIQRMEDKLREIAPLIHITLDSGYRILNKLLNQLCETPDLEMQACTGTHYDYEASRVKGAWVDRVHITLGIETLQSLLRTDLTDAERIQQQFALGSSLIHEFAHAVNCCERLMTKGRKPNLVEPYFENELRSELGFSLESNIFSSHSEEFVQPISSGPGTPGYGLISTDRFKDDFPTPGPELLPQSDLPKQQYTWPVPVKWMHNILQDNIWDVGLRTKGPSATYFGPLTQGTRLLQSFPDGTAEDVQKSAEYEFIEKLKPVNIAWTPMLTSAVNDTNTKIHKANIIRGYALQSRPGFAPYVSDTESEPDEMDPVDEIADEFPNVYTCPRWDEIIGFLENSRRVLQLALDTMQWMAEPVFYRHCRDYGIRIGTPFTFTPLEFRNFLGVANQRREYFLWRPFPGSGTVKRITAGWANLALPHSLAHIPLYNFKGMDRPPRFVLEHLARLFDRPTVAEFVYRRSGESMDWDMVDMWTLYCLEQIPEEQDDAKRAEMYKWVGNFDDFEACLVECLSLDLNYGDWTLGPKGIIRVLYNCDDLRDRFATRFTKDRIRDFRDQEMGLLPPTPPPTPPSSRGGSSVSSGSSVSASSGSLRIRGPSPSDSGSGGGRGRNNVRVFLEEVAYLWEWWYEWLGVA